MFIKYAAYTRAARTQNTRLQPVRAITSSTSRRRGHDILAIYKRPALIPTCARKASNEEDTPELTVFMPESELPISKTVQIQTSSGIDNIQAVPPTAENIKDALTTTPPLNQGSTVQGIHIPPKPKPPGEEDCCMSGCVHCVYTIYADDLEVYTKSISSARSALTDAGVSKGEWPEELREKGGDVRDEEVEKVEEGLDPTLAAFFALENRLKGKGG